MLGNQSPKHLEKKPRVLLTPARGSGRSRSIEHSAPKVIGNGELGKEGAGDQKNKKPRLHKKRALEGAPGREKQHTRARGKGNGWEKSAGRASVKLEEGGGEAGKKKNQERGGATPIFPTKKAG